MEIQQLITEMKTDVLGKLGVFTSDLDGVKSRFDKLQSQVDAIDLRGSDRIIPGESVKSVGSLVLESEDFKRFREGGFRAKGGIRVLLPGSALETKSNLTNSGLGSATSGVLPHERLPGVIALPRQPLRIRDLMRIRQITTGANWDAVKQSTRTSAASPQVESSPKAESTFAWTTISGSFVTIAHYVNISRQCLDDNAWVRSAIDEELLYNLMVKEETEILFGDNLGVHLNGISTQATAYDTATYNVSGDTKLDKLRHMKLQSRLAGKGSFEPSAYVLNPADMHAIELLKDETGGANKGLYVVGDPKTGAPIKFVWGLPVVESDSMPAGTCLVGPFATGSTLLDRMSATVEISLEHSSNFVANLATILCEERIGLAVQVPSAFIRGSY